MFEALQDTPPERRPGDEPVPFHTFWGTLVLLGWHLRKAAIALGGFVVLVTLAVHGPALFSYPERVGPESRWMWDILQRSNFVKNLCLLGVCFHLLTHAPGRYSLEAWIARRRRSRAG